MSPSLTESPAMLMQAAAEVARFAANVAMGWYHTNVSVETKGDGSPVTVADREAERQAREWLATRFPAYGLFGEEFDAVRPEAARRWILDPIDGTKAFVRGVPLWGTLVACCEGDTVLAGAACYPVVNELVVAAAGEGCWWNGTRAAVSTVATLGEATLLTTDDRFLERPHRRDPWQSLASEVAVCRTWGDCYGYLLVATGRAEIMVDDIVNPWDAAAMYPLITEAGGRFSDWKGRDTAFGGDIIATNSTLANATRRRLLESDVPSLDVSA
ncbi:histidinol-phosphatase [Gemmatimonas phototrophica]|uniref:Histidinol-phosphatase n=1 Tax=Gemmatimonas phototrophica TaxID=1379270 RepID=A0A143BGS2_9BACT|nr:histidinol-phosphatase [Gemmatimonas phototrophica]AMW03811.1 histidinol phosphate phosphatase [Gemmatimonas phototrophica]